MKLKSPKLLVAVIVAVIMAGLGYIGLDVPQSAVEETVEDQLSNWTSETENKTEIPSSPLRVQVLGVIDGDTAWVRTDQGNETLRFIGIDTPEISGSGDECYGFEATKRARELLQGQTVTVRTDPTQAIYDTYDRLLVYAELPDGRDFGEVMLEEGYAREYTFAAAYKNQQRYQTAEAEARASARGLWPACSS